LIEEDVEVIRWARSIVVYARRIDFRNSPSLARGNDEIVSRKIAKLGSIRSLLGTRGGRSGVVQLIIEDHGGNYWQWLHLECRDAKGTDDLCKTLRLTRPICHGSIVSFATAGLR
jgi:hypothetical protein